MNTTETHKYQLNQINLYGGDVKLFTTKDSNGIWYVKIWIHEEEKYYQKSLRTRDENYARSLAENEYVLIKAKRLNKQQIFSQTLHQVIDEWLEEIKKGVGISRTEGRYKVIVSQAKWLKQRRTNVLTHLKKRSACAKSFALLLEYSKTRLLKGERRSE